MKVTLSTKGVERDEQVKASGRDILDYESEFEESFLTATTFTQLSQIAWVVLRRENRFDGDYAEFRRQFVDLEEDFDDGGLDPVRPTQTDREGGS